MYHVSQISRPFTALTVRFLKMSDSAMSIVAGSRRDPEQDDVAAVPHDPEGVLDRASVRLTSRRPRPRRLPSLCSTNHARDVADLVDVHDVVRSDLACEVDPEGNVVRGQEPAGTEGLARSRS